MSSRTNSRSRDKTRDRSETYARYQERYRAQCELTRNLPHLSDDKLERLFAALRKAHAEMSSATAALSAAESPAQAKALRPRYEAAKRQLLRIQKELGAIDATATEIAGKARLDVIPKYTGRTR